MPIAVMTAASLAAQHPSALLPCPICAASLKGENLERHLHKTHAEGTAPVGNGVSPATDQIFHSRLRLEPGTLVLRRRFMLGRRRISLPASVEIGGLTKSVPSAGMTSYADDFNVPHDDVAAGTYLRLSAAGSAVIIGCSQNTAVRKHWSGWKPGPRRRSTHLRLDPPSFVALQYALAESGTLTLRTAGAGA
jgi:hypothetical protein